MNKKKRTRHGSRHATWVTIMCEWCGDRRECTREDTKTCGDKCRARLSFYVKRLGYPPDQLPGNITAQAAIDREVRRLIINERKRREGERDELRAYLSSAIGRKLSGAEAPHTH